MKVLNIKCSVMGSYYPVSSCQEHPAQGNIDVWLLNLPRPQLEELWGGSEMRIPALVKRFFANKIGSRPCNCVDKALGHYDTFMKRFNDIFQLMNVTDFGCETGSPMTMQNGFDNGGCSPMARADVDIVLVAQHDHEAHGKIMKTLNIVKQEIGEHVVIQTPNALTVVGQFPARHVQIITLYTKSILEYLMFCDLCCTSVA